MGLRQALAENAALAGELAGLTVQHTWHGPGRCQWTSGLC